jgi:putative endonuclease
MDVYYLYVLQSESTGRFYVGHTRDLAERLQRHDHGRSLFTKSKGPFRLVYLEKYGSRSEAAKREAEIKAKKSRPYIEQLIARDPTDLSSII